SSAARVASYWTGSSAAAGRGRGAASLGARAGSAEPRDGVSPQAAVITPATSSAAVPITLAFVMIRLPVVSKIQPAGDAPEATAPSIRRNAARVVESLKAGGTAAEAVRVERAAARAAAGTKNPRRASRALRRERAWARRPRTAPGVQRRRRAASA